MDQSNPPEPPRKQQNSDSITNVNIPDVNVNHVNMPRKIIYESRRSIASIRVDNSLYLDFKPIAKRRYGSVCKAFEAFMATVVALDKIPNVNISNTIVLNQKIERNLTRERRNLHFVQCERQPCKDVAEFVVVRKGKRFKMCATHAKEYRGYKETSSVEPLDSGEASGA
jgi:hypothetical protein